MSPRLFFHLREADAAQDRYEVGQVSDSICWSFPSEPIYVRAVLSSPNTDLLLLEPVHKGNHAQDGVLKLPSWQLLMKRSTAEKFVLRRAPSCPLADTQLFW